MIELKRDKLLFSFPEIHRAAHCKIEFQRTLRIPDDNREYPLPPGLGRFPLQHVDDHGHQLPPSWRQHGGVFLPIYQSEALWIRFNSDYPFAIKVAAGKINAVTGEPWNNGLSFQDYVTIPSQPWLDGFCVRRGQIRQFVAVPLGAGLTAEEQLTGEGVHGGLQIIAYPMRAEYYDDMISMQEATLMEACAAGTVTRRRAGGEMGMAPGGLMRQEIAADPYGIDAWDLSASSRCFVHLADALSYFRITGRKPPSKPPTARQYTQAGLPWFDYYGTDQQILNGAKNLAQLDSLAAKLIKDQQPPLEDNDPVTPKQVVKLGTIREGDF